MRLPNWFQRVLRTPDTEKPLDVERILTDPPSDRTSARQTVAQLKREKRSLVRKRRAVEKGFKRLSRGRTRMIVLSGGSPELEAIQLSQAMRDANAADQSGSQRKEQVAAIEGRIQSIDRAIDHLGTYLRKSRS